MVGAENAGIGSRGSEKSATSKTDPKGSQVSLRSPAKSGGAKAKEPLGSQASLKSSEKSKIKRM